MIFRVKLRISVLGVGDVKSVTDREVVRDITAPSIDEALRLAREDILQVRVVQIGELTEGSRLAGPERPPDNTEHSEQP